MQLSIQGYKATLLAGEEAIFLGHRLIGTGHLLLGLVRHGGIAAGLLTARGIDLEQTRRAVVALQDDEDQRSISDLTPPTP